jgi:hypothetical protein
MPIQRVLERAVDEFIQRTEDEELLLTQRAPLAERVWERRGG